MFICFEAPGFLTGLDVRDVLSTLQGVRLQPKKPWGSRSSSRDRVRQATGLPSVAMPSGKVKAPRPVDEFAKSYEEGMNNYYMHRYNEYKRLGYSDQERARQNL